jgi:hypothetical protein
MTPRQHLLPLRGRRCCDEVVTDEGLEAGRDGNEGVRAEPPSSVMLRMTPSPAKREKGREGLATMHLNI